MPGRPHLTAAPLLVALVLATTAGCTGGEVELGSPDLSVRDARACAALLAAVPDTLAGKTRRTDVGEGLGAVWGDPPLVLRCGVGYPDGFDPATVPDPADPPPCTIVNGIGWYVPAEQGRGGKVATFTAIGYQPRVALRVEPDDQPEGGAAALAELASVVKERLRRRTLAPALAGQRSSPCA